MAIVDLPDTPGPADVTWRPLDFGVTRVPPLGGPVQRINRSGNRWAVDVTLPPLSPTDTRRWQAALSAAAREGGRWKVRQIGLMISAFGAVKVAGAEQVGQSLEVDGGTAGAPWAQGQFFSLVVDGQRYLHQLAAAGSFAADGTATLPLVEPLRVSPSDNDTLDFAPRIEGIIPPEAATVRIGADRLGRVAFTIEEMG